MNKHFFLNHNCFCEVGDATAAIYDTNKKRLFDIDVEIGNVLKEMETGTSIEGVVNKFPPAKRTEIL